MKNNNKPEFLGLRQRAKERLKNNLSEQEEKLLDAEILRLIDITERKLLESGLIERMVLLSETERAGKIGGWSFDIETLTQNKILLQTIPFGMNIVDENGNILFMSEGLKQHFGNRTLDKKCWELYCDDKKQCKECPLRTDIKTGETRVNEVHRVFGGKIFEVSHTGMIFNGKRALLEIFKDITRQKQAEVRDYELRLKTETGELKYGSINSRLVFDAEGKPNHIDGEIKDITQRKLAEIELQASKDFLNSIINAVASPILVKDINHKYVLANNALCSLLKIPLDKIIGSTDSEYFPEEQTKVFIEKDMEVFNTGKESINEEYLTDGTGNIRTIVTRKSLYTDTFGNKFLVGIINDITERKQAEDALRESQMMLKSSIESPKDMIILSIDKQYNYLYFNTYHKNVMLNAYGKEVKLGMNLLDCINNEDDRIKSKTNYGRALNGESHTTIEEYGELTRYYYETRYNPILNDKNEVIGATAFSSNITERILAEKQIERLNRVYTVLSNINKTIVRVRDKQLLFEEACRIAVETGGFKMAWIGMVNSSTNKIDAVASLGITGEYINNVNIDLNNKVLSSGPAGQAIKSGKCNFSNNIETDYRMLYWREKARKYGFRSVISLPIIVFGKTIGTYTLYSGEIDFFNEDEIKLLEEMASDISFAIEFIESEKERKRAEKALRKSEAIQRKIVSNIGDVIVIIDQNGINRYKSPNIESLFGWKPEDLVGKSAWNVVHPDDLNSSQKIVAELSLIPNATETSEIRYMRKDGEYVWIEITLVNLLSDPDINGFLGNYHEITDRRLAQEKIREKDQEFRKLSSNLPDLIFQFTRRPDGTYYVPIASDGIKNIFGCTPEEVIDDFTPIGRVVHPDDVERVIAEIEQSAKHLTFFTCEFRVLIPGKPIQWIYSKSTPEKLPDGSVTWYGFNADITERRRVEDSLVKLKTAIDKSEISVVITDNNGSIEYANPFFNKLTGYSPEEYIGKTSRILKSAYHPKEFYQEMWNTIIAGETWEGEFYNCKKNGEMYWENAIISPIANNNNEITHFVAIKTDITHAKNINSELIIAKEQAEESDRLKSAFLANMSHEIRTPMNGILGFTELLKEPDLSYEQRKYFIGIIEKSGERLLNIINDIIDISKIESGLMKVKNSGINVNEYLDQVLAFFNPEAEAKNIKLICKPGLPNEEAILETDSEKFYAILINLVKNALKYTETGYVEFGYNRVNTLHATSLPNHSYLQFYVKDTGIGIPKDRLEAIFERFIQADIFDKMARQGAGLGLSISKAYVEMLRGKIWVESEEENLSAGKSGGSTFYFTLPYEDDSITFSFGF